MAVVKGSKQHQMVVVPRRPIYRAVLFLTVVSLMVAIGAVAYYYGHADGLSLRAEVVRERDQLTEQLSASLGLIGTMRQDVADLALGSDVDRKATEEVRYTVEALQGQVASLQEEIRFYKGVMLPNVDEKGLRIERLDISSTSDPSKMQYKLLLTQVVDEHELIQGTVEISFHGTQGRLEKSLDLREVANLKSNAIQFRFRYFQNIDGELVLPPEFVPDEILVVAQSTGNRSGRLERKFEWQPREG